MPLKRYKKAELLAAKKRINALIVEHGYQPYSGWEGDYRLETDRLGVVFVSAVPLDSDAIDFLHFKFQEPDKARAFGIDCNRFTGKHNIHLCECFDLESWFHVCDGEFGRIHRIAGLAVPA